MKIYQPSKDETAFLYQQAFELEPYVKTIGSLTVLVEEVENKKAKNQFAVTFVVAPEAMQFKVRAFGESLVEATMAAKTEALKQLNMLVNSTNLDSQGLPSWLH